MEEEEYKKYYDILEFIGNGAYGSVYKGKLKNTNEYRAIKIIKYEKIIENLLYEFDPKQIKEKLKLYIESNIKEYNIMKMCSQNNIYSVRCYKYFDNDKNFVIIMELCDKNLSQLLQERILKTGKGFNIEEIKEMMNQLNNTFKIMKENNIIHRDLKLENIMIKYNDKEYKDFTVKITDYGSSKILNSFSKLLYTKNVGTIIYMAPEILNEKDYNYKCDLWSIGIILFRLYFGKSPFPAEKEEALKKY